MATMRMKEGPAGTRIRWKKPTLEKLAKATAETLVARRVPLPPDNITLRRALKDVQPLILEPELRRDLPPITRMPWLRPMVLAELDRLSTFATPPPEPQHIISITVPIAAEVTTDLPSLPIHSFENDDVALIYDELQTISTKLDKFLTVQKAHEDVLANLVNAVKGLGGEVKGLGQIIIKGRERAAQRQAEKERLRATLKPAVVSIAPAPKPVRIAVVGLESGNQRRQIEDSVKGFTTGLDVFFVDDSRAPSQIPHFDQLIILERLARSQWQRTAEHLYGGRIHYARGLRATVDLIQKFGQRPEKYRAE